MCQLIALSKRNFRPLKVNISEALENIVHHPLEKMIVVENQEDEESRQTKLFQAVIEEDKKDKKESNSKAIILKVAKTPLHKLNNVMFKKMLIRFINFFFEEKSKTTEKFESFGDFVLSCLYKKYMMKKAADSRFHHLLSSCMKYNQIPRVRIFSRFLGLYDEFDQEDLDFYIDCCNFFKQSSIGFNLPNTEITENILVPYIKCVEFIKSVNKSISAENIQMLKEDLEKLKKTDKQSQKNLVNFDEFLEKAVEYFSFYKRTTRNFMKLIYEAADLNEDGYLQYREFELLIRFLSEKQFSYKQCSEIFEEYAENFMAEDEQPVKAMSFINLCQMDSQESIFSKDLIVKLTGACNREEAFEILKNIEGDLENIIQEIH